MTQQQRITYWQDLVEAQRRSGLDVTTFCRDRRIDRQRFYSGVSVFKNRPWKQRPSWSWFLPPETKRAV